MAQAVNVLHKDSCGCDFEVFLNNKLVTPSSTAYPYRAYIETILNFSKDTKSSQLTSALFYKDKAGKIDSVNPVASAFPTNHIAVTVTSFVVIALELPKEASSQLSPRAYGRIQL